MRNINFLEKLINLYPEYQWNISNIMYGKLDKLKKTNDGVYSFNQDINIYIPLVLLDFQVNQIDFDFLLNNSNPQSITSSDWDFLKLIQHPNFKVDIFLNLLLSSQKFAHFILDTDIYIDLDCIFKELSKKESLSLELINKYCIWDWGLLSSNINLNHHFLTQNRHQNWDSLELSKNPNFDINWIEIFPESTWDWESISRNRKLKLEWVLSYPYKKWNPIFIVKSYYFELSWLKILWSFKNIDINTRKIGWEECYNLDISWVKKFPKYKWSFVKLSYHPKFVFGWLDFYPNEKWDWRFLSLKCSLTIPILKKYSHKWCMYNLSVNNSFSMEWVKSFPDWSWPFEDIANFKNISLELLKSFPKISWNYKEILLRSQLDKNLIKYITSKYKCNCWYFISRNKSFDINWVSSSNYHLCDWYHGISSQETLKIEWIIKYPKASWNIKRVIASKNILIDDFQLLMKLFKLEIADFSLNPNLTLKFIEKYKHQLDFGKLSLNYFNGVHHQNNQMMILKKKKLDIFNEELIKKTWSPSRFWDWCLDMEDKGLIS